MHNGCPPVSVVIASFQGEAALMRCLESLQAQIDENEVIVVGHQAASPLTSRFAQVKFLEAPAGDTVFQLRSRGIAAARGDWIVLTEDHCTFAPRWLDALTRVPDHEHAVIGGPVAPGRPHAWRSWALFLCEYGPLLPPMPDGPATVLSGVNAAYRRDALEQCRSVWQHGFHENEVHDAIRARGYQLCGASAALARSHLRMHAWHALRHFFAGGRRFGSYCAKRHPPLLRLCRALAGPLIPVVLLNRILRRLAAAKTQRLGALLFCLPYLLCLLLAWTLGEVLGVLFPSSGTGADAHWG